VEAANIWADQCILQYDILQAHCAVQVKDIFAVTQQAYLQCSLDVPASLANFHTEFNIKLLF
jgi:hypothetical protein